MIIKNYENCKKCMWNVGNECDNYPICRECPNFIDGDCSCFSIGDDDVCPYFRLTGSQIPHTTTPNEFKNEIEAIIKVNDGSKEYCHRYMDNLMCRVLTELGYGEGIDLFENQPKWYA